VALGVAIVALVIAAIAVVVSAWQLREARRANAFPAALDLFREYRSPEMVKARRLLFDELPKMDRKGGIRALPDEVAQAALKVSHYLDNLGVLVAHGLLDPKLAAGFLGDSTLGLWRELSPFIRRERELRSPAAYQQYFEHLAATLEEVQPSRARANLRKSPSRSSLAG
jgi:hypothetical protein